MSPHGALS